MSQNFKETWEIYTASWKTEITAKKRVLFKKSLDYACQYNDPLVKTKGWDELQSYMMDFHRQIPGGYFVTTYFMAHSNKSIARWEMRNGENVVIGDGISYGEYNENGMLVSMTGFFEPPKK